MSDHPSSDIESMDLDLEAPEIVPADSDLASPQMLEAVTVNLEKLEGRWRELQAKINLPYPLEQVWQLLTDYETLAEFIPNLSISRRLNHPDTGIRIEQVGVQNALFLTFSARVVLDMHEEFPQTIRFQMVEGDFKSFSGSWQLEPWQENAHVKGTQLTYNLVILPKRTMPVIAIERRLRTDLRYNLLAIRQRLEDLEQSA